MTEAKFFSRESLFQPKYVDHEVADNSLRFYPLSVTMLWRMRAVVEPLVEALRVISGGKNDVERTVDQERYDGAEDPEGERSPDQRIVTHMGAIKPELARLREERADGAWAKAVDAVFNEKSRDFLIEMLTDSLRDEFTRSEAKDPRVLKNVMDRLDLSTLVEMVQGLVKANMRVFGPFAGKLRTVAQSRLGEMLGEEPLSSDSPPESGSSDDGDWSDSTEQPREGADQASA